MLAMGGPSCLCLRFITGSGKSQETLQAQPAGTNVTDVQSAPHTQRRYSIGHAVLQPCYISSLELFGEKS